MANFLLWITRTPTSARNYSRQDRQTCTLLKAAQKISLRIINQVGIDKTSPQYLTKSGEFEDLFSGIGKVEGKLVKLHIDPDVQPKQQLHRRIPFHVRQDVEKELERLESLDIIKKVTGPTPWMSPIVVVPTSSGEVRICIDMREANKAVKRENHLMPTIDDLVADLNGATRPLLWIPPT